MQRPITFCLAVALIVGADGCSTSVESTDDSVRVETELPKIETGDQPLDMDPGTDEDLDIDTPSPGDN